MPSSSHMAARKNGPPAQMLVAGSSIADISPTTAGAIAICQCGGLAVHSDRAPAQTAPAPSTTTALPSGFAHTWLPVPLNKYSDAPQTNPASAAHHHAEYAERVLR